MLYLTEFGTYLHFSGKNMFSNVWRDFVSFASQLNLLCSLYVHNLPLKDLQLWKPTMVASHRRNQSWHFWGKKQRHRI
jgi:hypothetical protein